MMTFDRARGISALDAAMLLGISLVKRGARYWANCPFHHEQTPSFLFNEDGTWHCFGCNRHGDANNLIAGIKGVSILQAANELAGTLKVQPTAFTGISKAGKARDAKELMRIVREWVDAEYRMASRKQRVARLVLDMLNDNHQQAVSQGLEYELDPLLDDWVEVESKARIRMDELLDDDPYTLMKLMQEELSREQHPPI